MTDLDKLIAAVEAGVLWAAYEWPATWSASQHDDAEAAMFGSLDAALRLHEALLPGWTWCPEIGPSGPYEGYMSPPFSPDGINVQSDNPARAWLLAILRALKAKGEA